MRKSFRGRAHPPKEPINNLPVLFPDSFNRFNRRVGMPVRLCRFQGFILAA
jgi:hypothetical protein